jgi:bifunctional DNase/RNase
MTKRDDAIQMSVGGLTLDPVTKTPIVILKDTDNKLNLPIWIGLLEATAMATEIEGIKMARPMTHDLIKNILGEVGCAVDSIEITDLKENTYFALVYLNISGRQVVIEASSILQQNEEGKEPPVENVSNVSQEKWAEILEKMTPDDFKYKM